MSTASRRVLETPVNLLQVDSLADVRTASLVVPLRYRAFISYSHRDEAVVTRMHRRLEAYRVPRRLVGRVTAQGQVPARMGRFFRDREELSASPDLSSSVRDALAESQWLLVVCSPHAARSRWVDHEINEFRRLHGPAGSRRILALIVSGEPYASLVVGREADECLPAALRPDHDVDGRRLAASIEPIAADLRVQGDGPRFALLKLVAGMLGVAFDDLVRRDMQRRVRWMMGITIASVGGVVLVGWLALRAENSRREAVRQRADAEGLVEFMLVDLRKQLDAVGRLDVLDAVGEKVLARYQSPQAQAEQDEASLAYRARTQHLIGDIRQQRGKLEDALSAYQAAEATTGRLLAMHPEDSQRVFDHAQSVFWVGYLAYDRHDMVLSEQYLRQYLALAQQLVSRDAADPAWQRELAYATQNLAVVWLHDLRFDAALEALTRAQKIWIHLIVKDPSRASDLALVLGWKSRALRGLGTYESAIEAQLQKARLYADMPDATRDTQVRYGLTNADLEIAMLELWRGRPEASRLHAERATERSRLLIAIEPGNAIWQEAHCAALLTWAEAQAAQRQWVAARTLVQRVDTVFDRLVRMDPANVVWNVDLLARMLVLKEQLRTGSSPAPSTPPTDVWMQYLARANEIDRRLIGPDQLVSISSVEDALARNLSRVGRASEARAHWHAIVERLEPLSHGRVHFQAVALLVSAYLAVGRTDEANLFRTRLNISPYRHPVHADLFSSSTAGSGPAPMSTPERTVHDNQ